MLCVQNRVLRGDLLQLSEVAQSFVEPFSGSVKVDDILRGATPDGTLYERIDGTFGSNCVLE